MHADLLDDSGIICMKGNHVHVGTKEKKFLFINLLIFLFWQIIFLALKPTFCFCFFSSQVNPNSKYPCFDGKAISWSQTCKKTEGCADSSHFSAICGKFYNGVLISYFLPCDY